MKIKNLLSNKKTLLSLIAGVTITLGAIAAGTYAWFTSNANVGDATFTTGKLALTVDGGGYQALNFVNGIAQNIDQIKALEDSTYTEANLEAWLRYFNQDRILTKGEYEEIGNQYSISIEDYDAALKDFNQKWNAFDTYFSQDLANALRAVGVAESMLPDKPADIMTFDEWLANGGTRASWPMQEDWNYQMNYLLRLNVQWSVYNGFLASLNGMLANLETVQNLSEAEQAELQRYAYEANILMWEAYDAMQALGEILYGSIVLEETDLVTPASLILGSYNFEVVSDIPAYFRVANIEVTNNSVVALAVVQFADGTSYPLTDGEDGFLYCPVAVNDGDEVVINIGAYVYGGVNLNNVQGKVIEFGGTDVEIIQATNNAAYIFWDSHNLPLNFFQ